MKFEKKFVGFKKVSTFALPDTENRCPDGEIGRRTVFRSQRSQGCAGSNPVLGTWLTPET